jgi:hypothetical protein
MRPATKSLLLLIRSKRIHAGILVNPVMDSTLNVDGGGKFEIIGKLKDAGYDFGSYSSTIAPKWVAKYIPTNFILLGICPVISMPLIHPTGCDCDECRDKIMESL